MHPVVAWPICTDNYPAPIAINGDREGCAAILMPDGCVHELFERHWPSIEDWLADAIEEAGNATAGGDRISDTALRWRQRPTCCRSTHPLPSTCSAAP